MRAHSMSRSFAARKPQRFLLASCALQPIPVFIKKRPNEWVYVGEYRCVDMSEDPTDIEPHAMKTGRDDITMVLRLERVREVPSARL